MTSLALEVQRLEPTDPVLTTKIVTYLKSQGVFDQFRRECMADVDTKPAYQNLRHRVEGSVRTFLRKNPWKPDMNKNQLRDKLRKHIHSGGFLDMGVDRIVDQVVNPKIYSLFLPKVEEVVQMCMKLDDQNKPVFVAPPRVESPPQPLRFKDRHNLAPRAKVPAPLTGPRLPLIPNIEALKPPEPLDSPADERLSPEKHYTTDDINESGANEDDEDEEEEEESPPFEPHSENDHMILGLRSDSEESSDAHVVTTVVDDHLEDRIDQEVKGTEEDEEEEEEEEEDSSDEYVAVTPPGSPGLEEDGDVESASKLQLNNIEGNSSADDHFRKRPKLHEQGLGEEVKSTRSDSLSPTKRQIKEFKFDSENTSDEERSYEDEKMQTEDDERDSEIEKSNASEGGTSTRSYLCGAKLNLEDVPGSETERGSISDDGKSNTSCDANFKQFESEENEPSKQDEIEFMSVSTCNEDSNISIAEQSSDVEKSTLYESDFKEKHKISKSSSKESRRNHRHTDKDRKRSKDKTDEGRQGSSGPHHSSKDKKHESLKDRHRDRERKKSESSSSYSRTHHDKDKDKTENEKSSIEKYSKKHDHKEKPRDSDRDKKKHDSNDKHSEKKNDHNSTHKHDKDKKSSSKHGHSSSKHSSHRSSSEKHKSEKEHKHKESSKNYRKQDKKSDKEDKKEQKKRHREHCKTNDDNDSRRSSDRDSNGPSGKSCTSSSSKSSSNKGNQETSVESGERTSSNSDGTVSDSVEAMQDDNMNYSGLKNGGMKTLHFEVAGDSNESNNRFDQNYSNKIMVESYPAESLYGCSDHIYRSKYSGRYDETDEYSNDREAQRNVSSTELEQFEVDHNGTVSCDVDKVTVDSIKYKDTLNCQEITIEVYNKSFSEDLPLSASMAHDNSSEKENIELSFDNIETGRSDISSSDSDEHPIKFKKPKIAANIFEVKKIMQARRKMKHLEKKRQQLLSKNLNQASSNNKNHKEEAKEDFKGFEVGVSDKIERYVSLVERLTSEIESIDLSNFNPNLVTDWIDISPDLDDYIVNVLKGKVHRKFRVNLPPISDKHYVFDQEVNAYILLDRNKNDKVNGKLNFESMSSDEIPASTFNGGKSSLRYSLGEFDTPSEEVPDEEIAKDDVSDMPGVNQNSPDFTEEILHKTNCNRSSDNVSALISARSSNSDTVGSKPVPRFSLTFNQTYKEILKEKNASPIGSRPSQTVVKITNNSLSEQVFVKSLDDSAIQKYVVPTITKSEVRVNGHVAKQNQVPLISRIVRSNASKVSSPEKSPKTKAAPVNGNVSPDFTINLEREDLSARLSADLINTMIGMPETGGKKTSSPPAPEKRKTTRLASTRQQRYDSTDLYKPRPQLTSRRSRATLAPAPDLGVESLRRKRTAPNGSGIPAKQRR